MNIKDLNSKDISRDDYIKEYHRLGDKMFTGCVIPNVSTFANAFVNRDKNAMEEIEKITSFTKNTNDIIESVNRRNDNYSEVESNKFMKSVIAANVTDITDSGWFYKQLISSCDDMTIEIDDCGCEGDEITLPITKEDFDYKYKNHWVTELNKYVEDYEDIPKEGTIHIRSFLTCKHGIRHFCKKCAGLFRRSYDTEFTPKHIGIYSTLMITEHATQASLDSMNKGESESMNVKLNKKIEKIHNIEDAKAYIKLFIDEIGNIGVESRFYEIAMLSRWRNNTFKSLRTSFTYQSDLFGAFIYQSTDKMFEKMISEGEFIANSTKTKIAFDKYDD